MCSGILDTADVHTSSDWINVLQAEGISGKLLHAHALVKASYEFTAAPSDTRAKISIDVGTLSALCCRRLSVSLICPISPVVWQGHIDFCRKDQLVLPLGILPAFNASWVPDLGSDLLT